MAVSALSCAALAGLIGMIAHCIHSGVCACGAAKDDDTVQQPILPPGSKTANQPDMKFLKDVTFVSAKQKIHIIVKCYRLFERVICFVAENVPLYERVSLCSCSDL
jgi:hypothetical protein